MTRFEDLTGQKFGKLTVIERVINKNKTGSFWKCQCECGNTTIVISTSLKKGLTTSCGCYRREVAKKTFSKHNKKYTRIYSIYKGMKDRCRYKTNDNYDRYGGKGVKVCPEWFDDFINFYNWAMANGYNDELTLDRIDSNGNYEPDNCRWVTYKQQANNTRRNNYITFNGETHTLTEWAEKLGIKRSTLSTRIHRANWDIEKALTTPCI